MGERPGQDQGHDDWNPVLDHHEIVSHRTPAPATEWRTGTGKVANGPAGPTKVRPFDTTHYGTDNSLGRTGSVGLSANKLAPG